jgi:hypothetical protein
MTRQQYLAALRLIATRLADSGAGWQLPQPGIVSKQPVRESRLLRPTNHITAQVLIPAKDRLYNFIQWLLL